ncbi:hypothetical protein CPB84DRAFT_1963073 [Gymnopilus junonius]|uniref:Uncharacterized protein n=1 Tax=Gymnopilus junonius TaxID=109634 RepID=A0A9P5TMS3_GYMJU|nr:hypothetical protein CPB84DRAFT_1963073 [Gymnopilus junonius]
MSLLEKSMQVMTLSDSVPPHATSGRPSHRAANTVPDQITPPVPSITPESRDRRIFYGFDVSMPWLVEFCEKHADSIKNYNPNWYPTTKAEFALKVLKFLSGVRNLKPVNVLCKVNEPDVRLGEKGYSMCVAVCSSKKSSWDRRPSTAQFERLKGLMGKEPDWFVDVNPNSFYRED